jgi:hypothetical protein
MKVEDKHGELKGHNRKWRELDGAGQKPDGATGRWDKHGVDCGIRERGVGRYISCGTAHIVSVASSTSLHEWKVEPDVADFVGTSPTLERWPWF